jgi:cation diffusion facilitator CzcD-associated flavoprotein CzcO
MDRPFCRVFTKPDSNACNHIAFGYGAARHKDISHMTADLYCIIGAGSSGLAVAKNFKTRGIPFEVLEREQDLGGLWNIATPSGIVYDSTHLVSAKTSTGFDDFPFPDENFPEYPSHDVVLNYFRAYAEKFGLTDHIRTGVTVEHITPRPDGTFDVNIKGEPVARRYAGVVLANGHHDTPRTPHYAGGFAGDIMHSRDYKSVRQVRDKRVLVVGAGNSACDIIRDAAHGSGAKIVMSMRRGTWFVPKFLLGFPTHDVVSHVEMLPLPRAVKRFLFQASLWVLQGPPERYGLPKPAVAIDAAHPTMSDDIPRLAAHGRLIVKPEISHYEGQNVVFSDGTREAIDLIVFATGYKITFPFLDDGIAFDSTGRCRFYLNTAHEQHRNLYSAGLIQANGSIWRLADYQGQIIANAIIADRLMPNVAETFRQKQTSGVSGMPKGHFVASERHTLEANYFDYRAALKRAIRSFGRVRKLDFGGGRAVAIPVDVAPATPAPAASPARAA